MAEQAVIIKALPGYLASSGSRVGTFSKTVGREILAEKDTCGWLVDVKYDVAHNKDSIWIGAGSNKPFIPDEYVEVVKGESTLTGKNPFAYWNAIKSSREVGAIA